MKKVIQIISIAYCVVCPIVIAGLMESSSKIFFTYFSKKNPLIPSLTNSFIENMGLLSTAPIIIGLLVAIFAIICQKILKKETHHYISIIIAVLITTSISLVFLGSYVLAMALPFININKSISVLPVPTTVTKSESPVFISNIAISPRFVIDPGINASRSVLMPATERWVQIDVDYKTPKNRRTKDTVWLENVSMKYDVLLPEVAGKPRVAFSGEVIYWALPLDGQIHHAQAFIHPKFLKRYAPNLKFTKSTLREFNILVTFERNGRPLGYGVYRRKVNENSELIKTEIEKVLGMPSTIRLKDTVFSRDKTPWGIINQDHYELIRPEEAQHKPVIDYSSVERLANRLKSAIEDEQNGEKIPAAQLKQFSKDFNLLAVNPNIQELTGVKRHWLHAMSRITGQMSQIKEHFYLIQVRNDEKKRKELIGKYKILFNRCLTMADPELTEERIIPNSDTVADRPQNKEKRTPEEIALIRQKILERMAEKKRLENQKKRDQKEENPNPENSQDSLKSP